MAIDVPSVWELLLPNWNIFSIIGALLIVGGILIIIFGFKMFVTTGFNIMGWGVLAIAIGVLMVWGISAIQDLAKTTGGIAIMLGVVVVFLLGWNWYRNLQKGNNSPF